MDRVAVCWQSETGTDNGAGLPHVSLAYVNWFSFYKFEFLILFYEFLSGIMVINHY